MKDSSDEGMSDDDDFLEVPPPNTRKSKRVIKPSQVSRFITIH